LATEQDAEVFEGIKMIGLAFDEPDWQFQACMLCERVIWLFLPDDPRADEPFICEDCGGPFVRGFEKYEFLYD